MSSVVYFCPGVLNLLQRFFVCLLIFPQKVAGSSRNKLKQRVLLWPGTEQTNDQDSELQKHSAV